jgi:radical SAM superfamily enzyme YgiQ (UPF0313 family)
LEEGVSFMAILVASAFESELQPLAAAYVAAAMRVAGAEVSAWDAHMFADAEPSFECTDLVLLSVQQFEGVERGLALARKLRQRLPQAPIVAFGQYAQLNSQVFLEVVDGVAMDEPERIAPDLLSSAGDRAMVAVLPGVLTKKGLRALTARHRLSVPAPARDLFRSLVHYPAHHSPYGLMGNIELTRGCHHKCTYCSVFSAYNGGVALYEGASVVADAVQLAGDGVRHFCFIDAEFFNSRNLGLEVVRQITREVGPITFEFTTRVDHILDYPGQLAELVRFGLVRVTSALEFPSDRILRIFDKGIDVADMRRAITAAGQLGFTLNPTFIPFTPWVRYEELLTFEDFLIETELAKVVHPTALQTRLLLFKGSVLLSTPWMDGVHTTDRGLWLDWVHPDRRVEELWRQRRDDAEEAGAIRCCVKC